MPVDRLTALRELRRIVKQLENECRKDFPIEEEIAVWIKRMGIDLREIQRKMRKLEKESLEMFVVRRGRKRWMKKLKEELSIL